MERSINVECAHPFLFRSQRIPSEKAGAHRERPMTLGRRKVKSPDFCWGISTDCQQEEGGGKECQKTVPRNFVSLP